MFVHQFQKYAVSFDITPLIYTPAYERVSRRPTKTRPIPRIPHYSTMQWGRPTTVVSRVHAQNEDTLSWAGV